MELGRYWWWAVVLVSVHLGMNRCFGCWERERIALLELKTVIFNHTYTWDPSYEGKNCCEWTGVECNNKTGRVIRLDLNNSFTLSEEGWYFDASLFLPLEELQYLDFSGNSIRGWVPNQGFERFPVLSKLEVLNLGHNHFNNNILSNFNKLPSLKKLYLSNNNLNGSIDIQAFKVFDNLEELYLSENEIDDFMTTKDSNNLSKLQVLDLSVNKFSAQFFESSAAFPSLKILDISYNNLEGSFTIKELGALKNLEQLYLDGSSIDKSFLHRVGVMTSLNVLTMQICGMNGILPAQGWCELRKLQVLDLSDNNFEGILPSCMANLTSLHILDLSYNHFNGNFSCSQLFNLTSLEFLSLSDNDFLDPIRFSSFFNLSNLKVLLSDNNKIAFETNSQTWVPTFQLRVFSLSRCSFDGLNTTPPTFLHYQYDLRQIDLSDNNLVGKFPNWLLENNTRLEVLILRNNSFTGPFMVPYHLHPNIRKIDISINYLQGPIPTNFGLIFPNLEYLNMSNNAFQGSIPSSFGNLISLKTLELSNNHLSGTIPVHFAMGCYSLEFLKLSYNNFSGQILSTNLNMTNLGFLYLDNNHFSGKVPHSISQISPLIVDFSNKHLSGLLSTWLGNMSIQILELLMARNQLEGPIPVELCKFSILSFLDLSENNLFGSVPSCFNSSEIMFVHLSKNFLSGPIPTAFQNKSHLLALNLQDNYLTGNIPNWINSLPSLSILLLKENHLEGRIPIQLCLLYYLNMLDLSYNKFSGTIPRCLSNISFEPSNQKPDLGSVESFFSYGSLGHLKSPPWAYWKPKSSKMPEKELLDFNSDQIMDETEQVEFTTKFRTYSYKDEILNYMFGIDLSCNNLTGEIPPELGRVSSYIRALNLSHNNLSGPIPATFSYLKQMESLDLSYNNLNGRIPPQLSEMTFLEVFSVAHNNLSGTTPDRKNQFISFNESSYEGNPLLCGPPLHNGCTKMRPSSTMPVDIEGEERGSVVDMDVFYVSFVVTCITVLLGIVAVLYINPCWRRAWFNLIEVCIDTCYCFVVVHYRKLFNFRLTSP